MPRIVSPPISQLDKLRQPLTEGERQVFDFFHKHLPVQWEIYVQPHLNGLKPDFVLLHPSIGIAVFEVKDWDLDSLDRWVDKKEGKPPILMGRRGGNSFSLQKDNPVEKVILYKDEIRELYCPRLDQNSGLAVITAGIIFPFADDARVVELLKPFLEYHNKNKSNLLKYYPITGGNTLRSRNLARAFPEATTRKSSIYMNPVMAADLRLWLVEPDAPKTQRTPLELDSEQRRLANSRTATGYRRITGPAGSGKSIVLAARVAQLVAEGKEVLIITFNITLCNYLADAAVRNNPSARKAATWLNFHHWCKRVCWEAGRYEEYKDLWKDKDNFPNKELCALVDLILDSVEKIQVSHYDAVIVDEGQDFNPDWWVLLRKIRKPGGEMLFAADATQDIYGTAKAWTDAAMTGAGFRGNWSKLSVSYRLPSGLISYVREFGESFLPSNNIDLPPPPPKYELNLDCQLRWVQVNPRETAAIAVEEIWTLLKSPDRKDLSVSDLTVLVDSENLGRNIVSELKNKYKASCIDTFSDGENNHKNNRHKKIFFFMGSEKIKATTLHSFKGWETRALVICIERAKKLGDLALLYAGLTRLKYNPLGSFLTVVCGESELFEYGLRWPDFADRDCSIDAPPPRYW